MKFLLLCLLSISIIGCKKEKNFVEEINSAVLTGKNPIFYGEVINIDNKRNVVYILDPTCSVCLLEYKSFCKYVPQIEYDSLTTIVVNSCDMLVVDSYLRKAKVKRPKYEQIIYDTDNYISRTLYRLSQGRNMMLFENRKLIFSCNMQEYMLNEKKLIHN
jgi:hypothetical protein